MLNGERLLDAASAAARAAPAAAAQRAEREELDDLWYENVRGLDPPGASTPGASTATGPTGRRRTAEPEARNGPEPEPCARRRTCRSKVGSSARQAHGEKPTGKTGTAHPAPAGSWRAADSTHSGKGHSTPEEAAVPNLTPAQRSQLARGSVPAPRGPPPLTAPPTHGEATTPPRSRADLLAFERLVDPDGELDPTERELRARSARRAHMARMTFQSSRVRQARSEQASSGPRPPRLRPPPSWRLDPRPTRAHRARCGRGPAAVR